MPRTRTPAARSTRRVQRRAPRWERSTTDEEDEEEEDEDFPAPAGAGRRAARRKARSAATSGHGAMRPNPAPAMRRSSVRQALGAVADTLSSRRRGLWAGNSDEGVGPSTSP